MIIFDSVNYSNGKISLNNLSFEIETSSLISIESTLPLANVFVDLLIGRIKPDNGNIRLNLESNIYNDKSINEIGIVYDIDFFYERLKVREYLKLFRSIFSTRVIDLNIKDISFAYKIFL